MRLKKSFLSALISFISIIITVIVILIDKPDYKFFDFIYKNIVPVTQTIGRGVTYPVRLIGNIAENIHKSRQNLKDNKDIIEKINLFDKINTENFVLQKENELLRKKLKITTDIKQRTIVANIIHNNSFSGNQFFLIKRNDDLLEKGNIVLSNNGFLLGTILENTESFSKIQSVKDLNSNIPVRIAGTDVFGFLQGTGSDNPVLRFLSNSDFEVEPGMFLITSGINGNIPDDIPVGRIKEIKKDEIIISLGAELKNQESVIILMFDRNEKYN
jgi:rod shape-determining protein MreC